MRFEFYLDRPTERWRWRIVTNSRQVVARSAVTYANRQNAVRAIHGLLRGLGVSPQAVDVREVQH